MIERLLTSAWNGLVGPRNRNSDSESGLDLGFRIVDGEVQRSRAYVPGSKRAEHIALLGKTGQGKTSLLRHLNAQDIRSNRGFVSFDMHGDNTPFLLGLVAQE